MKSKYKFLKGIVLCMLMVSMSCTDMLELTPVSTITNASFWKTGDDAEGALTGAYVYLRAQAALNLFIWGEARSEVMRWGEVSGTLDYDFYYNNTLSEISAGPTWQGLYTTVNAANLIIKNVPGIEMAENTKNNVLAQAYTMRAYLYFVMARTWGGVPVRTEPTEGYSPESTNVPRSTVEEVFTFIKQDLDKAIELFGSNNSIPAGRNRWSLAAANALKADVYLWTGKRLNGGNNDFNTAIAACNEVAKADVSLLPNFADIFEYANKGNKEIIMAVGFKELEPSSGNMMFYNMYAAPDPTNTDPVNGEIIGVTSGAVVWTITPLVMNQFSSDDTRKNPTFTLIPGIDWPPILRKGRGIRTSGVRYFSSDFIIYRYADVLLMKAEAKNALGQDPSAEINLVRQRAYKDAYNNHIFVNGSKEQNDTAILKERLLELVTEGKRWWDLIRFGKAFDIVPSLADKVGKNHYLLWPVSLDVLSLEPEIDQTEGW